jgi:hypothetical protein
MYPNPYKHGEISLENCEIIDNTCTYKTPIETSPCSFQNNFNLLYNVVNILPPPGKVEALARNKPFIGVFGITFSTFLITAFADVLPATSDRVFYKSKVIKPKDYSILTFWFIYYIILNRNFFLFNKRLCLL